MDKIKSELTEITEKYKSNFETEINGDKVFKTMPDITNLSDEYELKLEKELLNKASAQLKYIDNNNKIVITEFIRNLRLEFREFALAFLLHG